MLGCPNHGYQRDRIHGDAIFGEAFPPERTATDETVDTALTVVYSIGIHKETLVRFIGIREFRGNASKIMDGLKEEHEVVITSNGKPVAILTPTDERHLEESLAAIRSARALRAVTELQTASVKAGTGRMSADEIEQEIKAARDELRR
jgi:prevent-host-death family protein